MALVRQDLCTLNHHNLYLLLPTLWVHSLICQQQQHSADAVKQDNVKMSEGERCSGDTLLWLSRLSRTLTIAARWLSMHRLTQSYSIFWTDTPLKIIFFPIRGIGVAEVAVTPGPCCKRQSIGPLPHKKIPVQRAEDTIFPPYNGLGILKLDSTYSTVSQI